MAGYARLYESLGPLYHGNVSTPQGPGVNQQQGLKPITEDSSRPSAGSQRFEPAVSGQHHPAPGRPIGGSASLGGARKKSSPDEDDRGADGNNDNTGSLRRRPLVSGTSTTRLPDDRAARPGSPLPVSRTRDPLERSPRLSLRIPGRNAAEDRRTAANDTQPTKSGSAKSYDSTDNMRVGGLLRSDNNSSSDDSDTAPYRPTTRLSSSARRRQDADHKSDRAVPPLRARSNLLDDDPPLRRRPNLESKNVDSDSPPDSSFDHNGIRDRQRGKEAAPLNDELPLRRKKLTEDTSERNRRSPALGLDRGDELPVRRRRELDDRSDSPPLQSSYRRNQLDSRRGLASRGGRDESPPRLRSSARDDSPIRQRKRFDDSDLRESEDLPLRRRKARDSSPPLRSTSREEFPPRSQLDKANPNDRYSRSQRLSPRPGSLESSSKRGKELDDSSDSPLGDEISLRRRGSLAERNEKRASSPPLRSTSREDTPLTRRRNLLAEDDSSQNAGSSARNNLGLSPRRQKDTPAAKQAGRDLSPPRSGYKPSQLGKSIGETSNSRAVKSASRGDKEQPKAGALKRSSPRSEVSRRQSAIDKKKSSDSDTSSSDSDSSDKKSSKYRPPIRLTLDKTSKKGAAQSVGKSARSPHDGEIPPKQGRDLRSRFRKDEDNKSDKDADSKSRKSKPLTEPRTAQKSPRDTEKTAPKKATAKAAAQDDLSLGRQSKTGTAATTARTSALKPGSRDSSFAANRDRALTSPRTSLRDARGSPLDDNREFEREKWSSEVAPRSGNFLGREDKRDDLGFRKRLGAGALQNPSEFNFANMREQKLRLVKLKRNLPVNLSGTRYDLVLQAVRHIGFIKSADNDFKTPSLIWTDSFISVERLAQLKTFQRVNHFPGMTEIARKDLLAKNLQKLAKIHPSEYNFAPRTWCLPGEHSQFQQYAKESLKSEKTQKSFISKPVDGASGRGIKIYKTAEEVPPTYEDECVIQEYVPNPFLIENVKFDLRLYVLVTSCDPLRVYFYNDGFIRMSSEPYTEPLKCTPKDDMAFMHLTNTAVNQLNQPPTESASSTRRSGLRGASRGGNNKRPLRFLNEYLQKGKYDVANVWRNIVDLMVKTVFAAYPHLVRSYRQCRPIDGPASSSVCFEILGFDILLDAKLKPWLLEVNRSPSFDSTVTSERDTKLELIQEALMLLNFSSSEQKRNASAGAQKPGASGGTDGSSKDQKELADLLALQARLKRQSQFRERDARVCQRFRCIFPVDEPARQEKLVSLMLDAFPALLGPSAAPVQRELKAFYSSKTTLGEVTKQLAQRSSKAAEQLGVDSENSSSGDEENEERRSKGPGRREAMRQAITVAKRKSRAEKLADAAKRKHEQQKQKQKQQMLQAEAAKSSEYERVASQALKFLNQLSIRFPGKSGREAERMLRDLHANWLARKDDVSSYWRLSLDADKRRKVLDIARHNVSVALDKAFCGVGAAGASDGETGAISMRRLHRLFEKLYNRLLWCHGQGLWETFRGRAAWEGILRQSWETPTETEINCCRRVVQLCQDCLMIVYLYSDAAQRTHQRQQQRKQERQRQQPQQPLAVS